ncbi:MAG: signal recognition particle-docking protein FtsY [Bdellovibrionales bacterium]|nr:signal recognition particle-docking protein FtsY [Bdellovibrionales bacterium]
MREKIQHIIQSIDLQYLIEHQSTVALIVAIFALLVALGSRRRGSNKAEGPSFDRLGGVLSRVEKQEKVAQALRERLDERLEAFEQNLKDISAQLTEFTRVQAHLKDTSGDLSERYSVDTGATLSPVDPSLVQEVKKESGLADSTQRPSRKLTQTLTSVEVETGDITPDAPKTTTLKSGLSKTRAGFFGKLKDVFSGKPQISQESLEEIEELLVASDLGVRTATELIEEVRAEIKRGMKVTEDVFLGLLKLKLVNILEQNAPKGSLRVRKPTAGPFVVLVVGVNGVGKTTTIGKLAKRFGDEVSKVMIAAGDTFRAAAVEQLSEWGARVGAEVVTGEPEAKPSTVVYDAMERAKAARADVLIIDTAGRLHTKSNLMSELEGIKNTIRKHQPDAPHETLLVLDGSTGQNALMQAKEFNGAVDLTGLVITKLDGTPKGGVVVAIRNELGIPVRFIGIGESAEDLKSFDAQAFVEALLDRSDLVEASGEAVSAHGAARQRRRRETGRY